MDQVNEPPKSKLKLIIGAIVVLAVLAGAVYYYAWPKSDGDDVPPSLEIETGSNLQGLMKSAKYNFAEGEAADVEAWETLALTCANPVAVPKEISYYYVTEDMKASDVFKLFKFSLGMKGLLAQYKAEDHTYYMYPYEGPFVPSDGGTFELGVLADTDLILAYRAFAFISSEATEVCGDFVKSATSAVADVDVPLFMDAVFPVPEGWVLLPTNNVSGFHQYLANKLSAEELLSLWSQSEDNLYKELTGDSLAVPQSYAFAWYKFGKELTLADLDYSSPVNAAPLSVNFAYLTGEGDGIQLVMNKAVKLAADSEFKVCEKAGGAAPEGVVCADDSEVVVTGAEWKWQVSESVLLDLETDLEAGKSYVIEIVKGVTDYDGVGVCALVIEEGECVDYAELEVLAADLAGIEGPKVVSVEWEDSDEYIDRIIITFAEAISLDGQKPVGTVDAALCPTALVVDGECTGLAQWANSFWSDGEKVYAGFSAYFHPNAGISYSVLVSGFEDVDGYVMEASEYIELGYGFKTIGEECAVDADCGADLECDTTDSVCKWVMGKHHCYGYGGSSDACICQDDSECLGDLICDGVDGCVVDLGKTGCGSQDNYCFGDSVCVDDVCVEAEEAVGPEVVSAEWPEDYEIKDLIITFAEAISLDGQGKPVGAVEAALCPTDLVVDGECTGGVVQWANNFGSDNSEKVVGVYFSAYFFPNAGISYSVLVSGFQDVDGHVMKASEYIVVGYGFKTIGEECIVDGDCGANLECDTTDSVCKWVAGKHDCYGDLSDECICKDDAECLGDLICDGVEGCVVDLGKTGCGSQDNYCLGDLVCEDDVCVEAVEPITFNDEALKNVVCVAIGELAGCEMYPEDVVGLEKLSDWGAGITDLTGIEYLTGLTELYLVANQISDISALAGLTGLTRLSLHSNQIDDDGGTSALSELTKLTYLDFAENQISDISVLSGLTKLNELHSFGNDISNISVLSELTDLAWVSLSFNEVSDISALSELTGLTRLDLQENQIDNDDMSVLSGLTGLISLSLAENQISDISVLSGLTKLETLSFYDSQVSDISPLACLTKLEKLYLADNPVLELPDLTVPCCVLAQINEGEPYFLDELFCEDVDTSQCVPLPCE